MEKYNTVTYNYRYIRKYECNILEDILKLFTKLIILIIQIDIIFHTLINISIY